LSTQFIILPLHFLVAQIKRIVQPGILGDKPFQVSVKLFKIEGIAEDVGGIDEFWR